MSTKPSLFVQSGSKDVNTGDFWCHSVKAHESDVL